MITIQTSCPNCKAVFEWATYELLEQKRHLFVVPPRYAVECPTCHRTALPGEMLPVLSLVSSFRQEEDYQAAILDHMGSVPEHFGVIVRYNVANGELALCTMYESNRFFLIFLGHNGEVETVPISSLSNPSTELGAREKMKNIAAVIGATEIK